MALCTAFVLWRGASLIIRDVMTVGALTVFLAYLNKFFKPVQDLAKNTNAIAQATVSLERIKRILDTVRYSSRTAPTPKPSSNQRHHRVRSRRLWLRHGAPGVEGREFLPSRPVKNSEWSARPEAGNRPSWA